MVGGVCMHVDEKVIQIFVEMEAILLERTALTAD